MFRFLRVGSNFRRLTSGVTVIGLAATAFNLAHAHAGAPSAPRVAPLSFSTDAYSGVSIEPAALEGKRADEFELALRESCAIWRTQGLRGVWLHVGLEHSELVPVAVKQGFAFHHADSATLTLVRWLPETPCTLPAGPSHQVGVGAFVVNARNEVLMVKERSGPAAKYGIWKVPTGLLERGEDIVDGCRREVLEETGVRTTHEGAHVLSFRHAHAPHAGGVSDMFVMLELQLDAAPDAAAITLQESEIAEARWMPFDELRALQYYQPGGMLYEMVLAAVEERRAQHAGGAGGAGGTGSFSAKLMPNPANRPGGSYVYRTRL